VDIAKNGLDILLHLDMYLNLIIENCGMGTYFILVFIIFAETGFVIIPFLPGDSLLFIVGAFAALGVFNVKLLLLSLIIAAVIGDSVNYTIGKSIGHKIYEREHIKFIKKEHLLKTHAFYEKHGAITIIIARFIPIIRTFAPFVAGIGKMRYVKFISYNIIGGAMWVTSLILTGYYFGNLPVVKQNFTFVIAGIIFIPITPAVFGFLKEGVEQHSNEGKDI